MASRVNTRFVIILIVGVIALLGLLMLAYSIAYKSPTDLAKKADELMDQGEYRLAERLYSKSVNKDSSNAENLNKWIDALEHIVPETETEYRDRFYGDYLGAIKKTSTIMRNNIEAHERFLVIRHDMLLTQYDRALADALIEDTNGATAFFNEDPSQVSEWERLKRYRGLAIVAIAKKNGVLNDDQYLLAQEDLERALLASPDDIEAATGLMKITSVNADREIPEHDKEGQIESLEKSMAIADAFLATHPKSVEMAIQRIFLEADIASKRISLNTEGQARIEALQNSVLSYQDDLDELADRLLGVDSDQLSVQIVKLYFALESGISPESKLANSRRMIDHLVSLDKKNADLLLIAGSLAKGAGEFDESLGWYSQIADLETKPLSYLGFRQYSIKRDALLSRATIKVDQAQELSSETPQSELDEAIAQASMNRDLFAASVTDENLSLIMIDGKIERLKGNLEEALRLFKKFNTQTRRENLEGLWQEGLTASQLRQYGVAREALIELIPQDTTKRKLLAMLTLAQIHEQLRDYEASAQLYSDVLALSPTLTIAEEALDRMNKLIHPELNEDPVVAAIYTARQMRMGTSDTPGDSQGAIEYLRESVELFEYDPRIARELASVLFDRDDIEGTMELLNKTLALYPEEDWITTTLSTMDSNDPVESRIGMIRQSEGPALGKLLSIAKIAFDSGRDELFEETIAELNEIAPNDKSVVEMNFVYAVRSDKLDDARAIATRSDISRTDALSFNARLAVIEEQPTKAIELLEQATASGTADASIFQMLAILKRNIGDLSGSIQAFESSLSISPNNPVAIGEYLMTLTRAGDYDSALSTARRLQRFGASDTTFMNLWLNLESISGGVQGQEFAIEQRKRMLKLNPQDIENRGQLARMYIISKQWDEARTLIDGLLDQYYNLQMVELDATWYADQGIVNNKNGLVLANEVFAKYIDSLESPVGAAPFIANAEFMLNRGRPDLAVVAANEAVERQSPETMLGSKLLGDLYMRINNFSRAVTVYQTIIDGGADTDFLVRNRLISTLTTLGRFEEAQVIYDQLPERMRTEMITMLQAADIAEGLGDPGKASKLLDDAVSRYSTDSYVYIKRAESMIGDETLLNDMLSDLARALDLQPNDWRAYRVRAAGYFALDRREDALNDLRTTIEMNPNLDKSIFAILNELLSQTGRAGEAMDIARDVLSRRPDDANLMSRIGGLFASRRQWDKASEIYSMAWSKRHAVSDGAVYIDSLVRMEPPNAQEANRVINELAKMVGNINQSAGLLAAQALVLQARGREDFALQQITKAFDLSVDKDNELLAWSGNLSRYFEDEPTEDHIDYLLALKRRNTDQDIHAWLDLFIARRVMSEEGAGDESFDILKSLLNYTDNTRIQLLSYKLYGSTLYSQDKFAQAAQVWEEGVGLFSDDWELNNNLAYVLSTQLDRLDDAMTYGQVAIDKNLARSEAYETMAGIYIQLGKFDEAEQMIDQGSNYLTSVPSRVTMLITTGRLELKRGNMVGAQSALTDASSVLRSSPTAYASLNSDIEAFKEEIDSADD